jgi:hypothetical protein
MFCTQIGMFRPGAKIHFPGRKNMATLFITEPSFVLMPPAEMHISVNDRLAAAV